MFIKNHIKYLLALITGTAFFFASCSTKTSSTASNSPEETLRVMAYNIHHSNPPLKPGVIDIEAIANVIGSENPDLVALQEVDVNTTRSGAFNQAAEIASRLNMHCFFGKAIDYQGGAYGIAILSKYPLTETTVHRLPTQPDTNGEPRIMATTRVTLPDGTPIRFGSTHLDAQKQPVNRQLQIEEIVKIAAEEDLPFILAGDFNAVPDSEVINVLEKQFKLSCKNCPFTSSANNPVRTIDYIAFRDPSQKLRVVSHRVVNEKHASDHLPVVADFKIVE
jgi:endonuclease/exonuclease/phosphatase family metal-dependent hydrolase